VASAITALYLLLQNAWLALTPFMAMPFDSSREADWPREAAEVRSAAATADAAAPAEWRAASWRLGFQIGYVSQSLGSFVMSPPENQAKAKELMAPRLQDADRLARSMGVGPASALSTETASDFARLDDRLEQDELGLAARVQATASARHRHLLMLGMHVGAALATAQWTGGAILDPKRPFIGRHATLAGVPPAAWEPTAEVPRAGNDAERLERYSAAANALGAAVDQLESWR
jgi:hypothetical protein